VPNFIDKEEFGPGSSWAMIDTLRLFDLLLIAVYRFGGSVSTTRTS
jgi:hypothetical protein